MTSSPSASRPTDSKLISGVPKSYYGHGIPLLPELWLQILPYLSRSTLQNPTLTCGAFCDIAQSILFQQVHLCGCSKRLVGSHDESAEEGAWDNSLRGIYDDATRRIIQHLQVLTSPRIVAAIQTCTVCPAPYEMVCWMSATALDAIFDALPRFPSLRRLTFNGIRFKARWIYGLCALRPIDTLILQRCDLPAQCLPPITLNASFLQIISYRSWTGDHARWLDLASPGSVTKTYFLLFGDSNVVAAACRHIARSDVSTITSLNLTLYPGILPEYLAAIDCCFNLDNLIVNSDLKTIMSRSPIPPCRRGASIPRLTTYRGPTGLLAMFTSRQSLRHICLGDFYFVAATDPVTLSHALFHRSLVDLHEQVQHLEIYCEYVPQSLLSDIFATFGQLEILTIHAARDDPGLNAGETSSAVFPSILFHLAFPTSLETFRLTVGRDFDIDKTDIGAESGDFKTWLSNMYPMQAR